VQFEHDPDCTKYPEVYQAWKAAGQEDNMPTLAICPSVAQWAVGMGGKANALRAAKLALALTLAAVSDPAKTQMVCRHFPEFKELCAAAKIEVPDGAITPAEGSTALQADSTKLLGGGENPQIVTISVPETFVLCTKGYTQDTVAIEFSKEHNIFSDAHHVLQSFFEDLVGGNNGVCQFDHDPECAQYPEVYEAWKRAGQGDNCPTIATCPNLGVWAVGFGGKANALRAAKLALSLILAQIADPVRVKAIMAHYPDFGKLCTVAGIQR